MAAGKGGDFGTTIGNLLIPQTMQNLQAYPLRQKEIEKEQTQDEALKVVQNMIRLGAPMPATQRVGALAFPDVAAARAQEKLFPAAPKPMLAGKDQRIVVPDGKGGFKELLGAVPDAPKVPDELIPGVAEARIRIARASRAPEKPEKPKTIAERFKELTGSEPPIGFEVLVDANGNPTGKLRGIEGGSADVGNKGLPQAYKDAMAGYDSLEGSVNEFQKAFEGTPATMGPDGKLVPAVPGLGTEMAGEGAGKLDSLYAQILFAVKNAEQTGALDKGSVDVIQGMLRKPTGIASPLQNNSYTSAQIKSVQDWIKRNRAAKQKAFGAGNSSAGGDVDYKAKYGLQ